MLTKTQTLKAITKALISYKTNVLDTIYAKSSDVPSIDGLVSETSLDNRLSNLSIVTISQSQYNALETKDSNVLYLIINDE